MNVVIDGPGLPFVAGDALDLLHGSGGAGMLLVSGKEPASEFLEDLEAP